MSQNEASLHDNVTFELKIHFQRYYLFAIDFCYFLPKKTYIPITLKTYIFAQWAILQDKTLPVQSQPH